ncbi:Probable amino-acid ABC transporter-binding protein HI_1080 precursor [Kingella kingae]|nr:Histidine ABC superfamily ATP binding cassette transporter, binding protein [Kingella kingae]STR03624.1 Probable amino-acid ABC transporter-binding protein HI_1080 precursor [Kingella kingae]
MPTPLLCTRCTRRLLSPCPNLNLIHYKSTENKIASAPAAPTVYRVATDPTYSPFEFGGEQGKMQGLDIDILTTIAKKQQFEIQFYAQKWDVLLNELPSNRADMVTGALITSDINPRASRAKRTVYAIQKLRGKHRHHTAR